MKDPKRSIYKTLLPILGLSLGLIILSACSSSGSDKVSYQDIVWQWVNVTDGATHNVTAVPNPENYTITFQQDGNLNGKADCNQFAGSYTYDTKSGAFSITLGPSTLAFCGEASLDQQYLNLLSSVAAGGPTDQDGFALESAGGAQRMIFQNGGAAAQ
jgi:heat shock protein HslJ